jgi:hypothetical protein
VGAGRPEADLAMLDHFHRSTKGFGVFNAPCMKALSGKSIANSSSNCRHQIEASANHHSHALQSF